MRLCVVVVVVVSVVDVVVVVVVQVLKGSHRPSNILILLQPCC